MYTSSDSMQTKRCADAQQFVSPETDAYQASILHHILLGRQKYICIYIYAIADAHTTNLL